MARKQAHFRKSRGRSAQPKKPTLPKEIVRARIDQIGAKGDGLAKDDQGIDYFVPYSAPGDVVDLKVVDKRADTFVAQIQDFVEKSSSRIDPPCPYYTKCGGCSLQHINAAAYGEWKSQRVQESLKRSGIDIDLEAPVLVPAQTRRRAAFAVMKKAKKIVFGFNARSSHRIEEIESCLLLNEQLNKLITPLRTILDSVMKQEGRGDVIVNFPENTCDIVLALPGQLELKAHQALTAFAEKHNIARLSWQADGKGEPEIIAQRNSVVTHFSTIPVELPPSPFLQPSKEGEEALVKFALDALNGEKKILDLYCGCGSFTFALAQKAIVHGVESNSQAIRALELSAGRANLGGRITCEVRDLARQPVQEKELDKYDAVLFDPPRAGAKEQAEWLAKSDIPLIIAISCNPQTFARDARTLIDGGYTLEKAMPVDQFTWSAHVEVAAIFRKEA